MSNTLDSPPWAPELPLAMATPPIGQGRGGGGPVGVRGNDVVVVQLAGDLEDGGDNGNLWKDEENFSFF